MRAVLFDIDGTLLNTRGAGRAALVAAFTQLYARPVEHEVATSGRTDRAIARDFFRAHNIDDGEENWQRFSGAYLQHLPVQLVQRQGRLLPGVTDLLTLLAAREDVLVGLLTGNTREGARIKLEHFGIHERFAFGAFGDVHFERDSVAVDALHQVRGQCEQDIDPQQILVIGDTPHDIQCARHIGARVLALPTGVHPPDELAAANPDVLMDDLSDVEAVVSLLDH